MEQQRSASEAEARYQRALVALAEAYEACVSGVEAIADEFRRVVDETRRSGLRE